MVPPIMPPVADKDLEGEHAGSDSDGEVEEDENEPPEKDTSDTEIEYRMRDRGDGVLVNEEDVPLIGMSKV